MEDKKAIIEKIKKVLALAENNPSEEEALAAALKAQKMMAQYHIDEKDLGQEVQENNIDELVSSVGGKSQKWKISLAVVLAKNFRCKVYLLGSEVAFFGYEEDIKICSEVFQSLYKIGVKLSDKKKREYREKYGTATGVRNSFCAGFVDGIKSGLEKQCTALMIIVPKEVNEKYSEKFAGNTRSRNAGLTIKNGRLYSEGFERGKEAVQSRTLEQKN